MRSVVTAVSGALLLALLAACAPTPQSPGTPEPSAPSGSSAEVTPGPLGLVNLWRVSDAEGEGDETWLRLDLHQFQLWRECGMVQGGWAAAGALFIAAVSSASGDCVTEASLPSVPWLEEVASYHETFEGWALLDRNGVTMATLSIDGAPEPDAAAGDFYTEPPEITDEVRAAFEPIAPLPADLSPATEADLLGRWVPIGAGAGSNAHAEFHDDGTWTGSDGCNGQTGAWAVDGSGLILATWGPTTLIGCDDVHVPSWVTLARSAGMNGDHLVLFDAQGTELGTLARG